MGGLVHSCGAHAKRVAQGSWDNSSESMPILTRGWVPFNPAWEMRPSMKANSMTQSGHSSLRVQWLATLLVVALAGVLAIVAPAPARADKSITWTAFDVTIDLQQDGSYHVTERQQIDFSGGTFTGGFATLPLDHTDGIDNIGVAEVDDFGKTTTYTYKSSGSYDEDPNTFTYSTGVSSIEV